MSIKKNTVYFAQLLEAALQHATSLKEINTYIHDDTHTPQAIVILRSFLLHLKSETQQNVDISYTYKKNSQEHIFFTQAVQHIEKELSKIAPEKLSYAIQQLQTTPYNNKLINKAIWELFAPEAYQFALQDFSKENFINYIQKERKVTIEKINTVAIQNPVQEILFTANVLFTVPKESDIDNLDIPQHMKEKLHTICKEPQQYWYDHPMPIGVDEKANELLYGLRGLSETLQKEKELGTVAQNSRMSVAISVSLTHTGLESIISEYLHNDIQKHATFDDLDIYIFTENKTKQILDILEPLLGEHRQIVENIFGVNGRYGRHYSFLKVISAIWNVCKDKTKKATFKIDLDQVFPQDSLLKYSGITALSHFRTPLWGATGKDNKGKDIYLGMLAGALVNEADIHKGLFIPDVNYPHKTPEGEELFFPRQLLMALSTRAEMMTQYPIIQEQGNIKDNCIHRIHVTGGTNGILIEALRKYRPFTPTCIGRAEDQAYLLSVYNNAKPYLRYVHASGLIMRHDKAAFAGDAIHSSKLGTFAGDLLRIFLFSRYATLLPEGIDAIKEQCFPFTSSYISKTPVCLIMIRLFFQVLTLLTKKSSQEAMQQIQIVVQTLYNDITKDITLFSQEIQTEQQAWNILYDSLNTLEQEKYYTLQENINTIIKNCKL